MTMIKTLKQIERMVASYKLDLSNMFNKSHPLHRATMNAGIEQAILEHTDNHFNFDSGYLSDYSIDACKDYLTSQGYDLDKLTEEQSDQLESDIQQADSAASRDAEFVAYRDAVFNDIQNKLDSSGLYYCFVSTISHYDSDKKRIVVTGYKETKNMYDASHVMLGITHKLNNELRSYDDEAPDYTLESIVSDELYYSVRGYDYYYDAYASTESVIDIFKECNEVKYLLDQEKRHWESVAAITSNMMQVSNNEGVTITCF